MKLLFTSIVAASLATAESKQSLRPGRDLLQGGRASSYVGNCMQDNWTNAGNNQLLVCEAKEVTVTGVKVDPTSTYNAATCNDGETIQVTLTGDINFNAERYDPGWYVATDGGDALTGQCSIVSLTKAYLDSYQLTNGASVIWDKDGSGKNAASDVCGDIVLSTGGGTDLLGTDLAVETPVICKDDDNDGYLDVAICFSWRTKGKDGVCNPRGLFPGTPAKCDCAYKNVVNMKVIKPTLSPTASPTTLAPVAADDPIIVSDPIDDSGIADGGLGGLDGGLGGLDGGLDGGLADGGLPFFDDAAVTYDFPTNVDGEALAVDAWDGTIQDGEDNCLVDVNWPDYVSDVECAAGEVNLDNIRPGADVETLCVEGSTITMTLYGDITYSGGRYQPSWYVATDGGDALNGQCKAKTLETGSYNLSNGSVDFMQDGCGDIIADGETTLFNGVLIKEVEVACVDEDDNGELDFSICFGWDNSGTGACHSYYPVVGYRTECDCSRHNVPIEVIKADANGILPC